MNDSTTPPNAADPNQQRLVALNSEEEQLIEGLRAAAERAKADRERLAREAAEKTAQVDRMTQERDSLQQQVAEELKTRNAQTAAAVDAGTRRNEMLRNILATLGVLAIALLGYVWYSGGPTKVAGLSEADFNSRLAPLTERVTKLEGGIKTTNEAIATLDGRFSTFQNTMDSIKKLIEDKNPAPPATSAAPPAGDLTRQAARLKAECPENFLAENLQLNKEMSTEEEKATIEHCRHLKAEGERVASPPAGAAGPQVAHSDPDQVQDEDVPPGMQAAREELGVQPAGYRGGPGYGGPGYGGPGYGRYHGAQRGRPSCRQWPGFRFNPTSGQCELTRGRDGNVVQYDRPNAGCAPGSVQILRVPLPHGGTRTITMRCRSDRGGY